MTRGRPAATAAGPGTELAARCTTKPEMFMPGGGAYELQTRAGLLSADPAGGRVARTGGSAEPETDPGGATARTLGHGGPAGHGGRCHRRQPADGHLVPSSPSGAAREADRSQPA